MGSIGGRYAPLLDETIFPHLSQTATTGPTIAHNKAAAKGSGSRSPTASLSNAVILFDSEMEDRVDMIEMASNCPETPTPRPRKIAEPSKRKRTTSAASPTGARPVPRPEPSLETPVPSQLRLVSTSHEPLPSDVAYEFLHAALRSLKQAHEVQPFYKHLLDGITTAIKQVADPRLPTAPPICIINKEKGKGLEASSWATVAASSNRAAPAAARTRPTVAAVQPAAAAATAAKAATVKDPGPKIKGPIQIPQGKKIAPTPAPKKVSPKDGRQLILKRQKDFPIPEFNPLSIRNAINAALQTTAVLSAEITARENIVITTVPTYSAQQLLEKQALWEGAVQGLHVISAEIPAEWIKLVAHGIPILPDMNILQFFADEAKTFNNITVLGAPRWLTQPKEGQRNGSVVFAVADTAEKNRVRQNGGIYIAGILAKVRDYRDFTPKTQCFRCGAFGHNPRTCRKPTKCALCSENHFTKDHSCGTCKASGPCGHIQLKCVNCSGPHAANSRDCEVFRAISQ